MASPALSRPRPRRKKTAPPPTPSPDNSSSDDDNASEKEEEEKTPPPAQPSHKNDADDDGSDDDNASDSGKEEEEKTPPPAQPSDDNDADDDGSDDDDDNASDSEKEEEEKTPHPAQPFHENDADDDGSDDDDDDEAAAVSEDGEEVEMFEKHGTGSESGTSVPKPQAVTLTPLAVAGPSGEQERRLELVATAETFTPGLHTESKSKAKWTDAEQLMLLKEMVSYSRRNGDCKISNPYMTKFRTSIDGLPICKFSACQILEKMKTLKKKHDKPNGFGQGKGVHLNPFDEKMLKLSEKLWGEYGKGNGKKRKRADVKDKVDYDDADNAQDDDDAGYKKRKRADVKDKVDYDDADNAQDDDDAGYESDDVDCARLVLLWQDAMVGLAGKKLAWPESFTRHRIAAMDDTRRDAMARKWIKGKGDLDSAMVNFSRVEDDCLVALLPPY